MRVFRTGTPMIAQISDPLRVSRLPRKQAVPDNRTNAHEPSQAKVPNRRPHENVAVVPCHPNPAFH